MKKICIFLISIAIFTGSADARWYWPSGGTGPLVYNGFFIESKSYNSGGPRWCTEDSDTTSPPTAITHAAFPWVSAWSYTHDSRVISSVNSTQMRCQRWDNLAPSISFGLVSNSNPLSNDTWTRFDVTSSGNCSDTGWSWCNNGSMQYRIENSPFSCNNWGSWTTWPSYPHTTPNNTVKIEYICYRVRDFAGNGYAYSSVATIKIDKQVPTLADVINNNDPDYLAVNGQNYEIDINANGWAPIDDVEYTYENTIDESQSSTNYATSVPFDFAWNISNVDGPSNNFRKANGWREYTFRLRSICDQADNCWTWNEPYNHDVFANTTSITASTPTNNLSSQIVADGTVKNITVNLVDQYGNGIVPASGISRTVDINVRGNNQLRRNQYLNNGTDSAIFVDGTTLALPVSPTALRSLDNRASTDGNYTIPFYIYGPTSNANSLMPWSANITVHYDINGSLGVTWDTPQNELIWWTSTTINALPLFNTVISWSVATQWFLEWTAQDITINVAPANGTSTSSRSLRGEFGDVSGSNNIANTRYGFAISGNSIQEWQQTGWAWTTQLNSSLSSLNNASTFMTQDGPVGNQTFSYLASIVKYSRSGKTIVYPWDIIWKTSYHGAVWGNNSYQEGIKIIWNTSSQWTGELVVDQFDDDVRILGKLTKSTFRRDISENVYEVTRFYTGSTISWNVNTLSSTVSNPWEWNNSSWLKLFWNKVLFYKNPAWWRVDVSGGIVEGQKTLVVESGDVYINGNIRNDSSSDMLWIIVLDGNIYIDSTVSDVEAALYTNESILSSIAWNPVTTSTNTASNLENQLYIRGSIFSENTIWGSRASPIKCPYNISATCDRDEAQKYDLNYMRRYYIYDSDSNGSPDTASWDQSFANTGTRWSRSDIESFPVIIEYNPIIQQTPPPFFD